MTAFTKGTPVIVAEGLFKAYDKTEAVLDLSFEAWAGSVFALLGPNGAGKTTTINMLTTLLPIDKGRASVAGFDLTKEPEAVRQVIGLAGQAAAVDEKLTARENLDLFGRLYKIPKAERRIRVKELIERFRMTDYANRPVGTYSGGQHRRLDVVASLIANPPALFLDEPTTGLDPRSRVELWEARINQDGTIDHLRTFVETEDFGLTADHVYEISINHYDKRELICKIDGETVFSINDSTHPNGGVAIGYTGPGRGYFHNEMCVEQLFIPPICFFQAASTIDSALPAFSGSITLAVKLWLYRITTQYPAETPTARCSAKR